MNEDLFLLFDRVPDLLPLYEAMEQRINAAFPQAKRKISKTQVSFSNRYGFAYVWPPTRKIKGRSGQYLILTFGLGYRLDHPRVEQVVEPYPNRWTHHVVVTKPEEMDRQIMGWLQEAWDFSMGK